jgi:DHA1 family tetracycline resistance protein-like MFS transporter
MRRSPLLILALTLFIDMLGFGLILPLIPVYISHYGGGAWVGGMLLGCYSLMQFLTAPLWGRLSDRIGRRPVILIGLCGSAGTFLTFGLAPNLFVLFLARVAAGALTSASLPTAQAYIADVTPPEKRASGMAVLGIAFGLGFAFGPVVGGYASRIAIGSLSPIATPALLAALLSFCNFLWALAMLPESLSLARREAATEGTLEKGPLALLRSISAAFHDANIRAQLLVFAFVTFAFTAVESSFSWLVILRFHSTLEQMAIHTWQAHHLAQPWASLPDIVRRHQFEKIEAIITSRIFLIVGLSSLVVQGFIVRGLAHFIGEHYLVRFGAMLMTLTLIGIGLAPSLLGIYLLSVCIAIAMGVMTPSLNALITHAADPSEIGTLSGVQQGLGSLARIIAPPINNYLIGLPNATGVPFFCSAVLMAIAFLLSLQLKPMAISPKGENDATEAATIEASSIQ